VDQAGRLGKAARRFYERRVTLNRWLWRIIAHERAQKVALFIGLLAAATGNSLLPSSAQVPLLGAVLSAALFLLTLAQRLGDWRSKKAAWALAAVATVLGLSWFYLICLWVFKVDVRHSVDVHWALLTASVVLGAVALAVYARSGGLRWLRRRRGPILRFGEWHGGTSSGYPAKFTGGAPSWISIRNTQVESPEVARNVTVRIEWVNATRTARFHVPEADWYVKQGLPGRRTGESWSRSADIEGGDEQSCILLVTDDQGRLWVYKHGTEPVGVLDYGRWTANLLVVSDNAEGFEGNLGFTLTRSGLFPDRPRAFTMRQSVPPGLRARRGVGG
jgi:hypothetical protein